MKHIEVEGGELILKNSYGDISVIPARDKARVQFMVSNGRHGEIDEYVSNLPKYKDYAEDGTIVGNPLKEITTILNNSLSFILPKAYTNLEAKQGYTKDDLIRIYQKSKVNPNTISEQDKYNLKDWVATEPKKRDVYNTIIPLKDTDINVKKNLISRNDMPDDIKEKEKQKYLLENDFYDNKLLKINADASKDEIKYTQNILKSNNLDLGKGGVDGIYGDKTKKALQDYNQSLYNKEVDAIIGNKTKVAIERYNKSDKNFYKIDKKLYDDNFNENKTLLDYQKGLKIDLGNDINTYSLKKKDIKYSGNRQQVIDASEFSKGYEYKKNKGEIEEKSCAKNIRTNLVNNYNIPLNEGVANAWQFEKLLPKEDYSETIRLTADGKNKKEIQRNLKTEFIKNKETIETNLKDAVPLSIVYMMYTGTDSQMDAKTSDGKYTGTHVGMIVDINGKKMVEDEVGGKVVHRSLESLLNPNGKFVVIGVSKLNAKDGTISKKVEGIHKDVYQNFQNINPIELDRTETIGSKESDISYGYSKEYSKQISKQLGFTDDENNNLIKAIYATLVGESGFNVKQQLTNKESNIKGIAGTVLDLIGVKDKSYGIAQMKIDKNIDATVQKNSNITKQTIKNIDTKGLKSSIGAAGIKLASQYEYIKNYLNNKKVPISDSDLWKLSIIGYNVDYKGVAKSYEKYKDIKSLMVAYKDQGTNVEAWKYRFDAFEKQLK